MSRSIPNVLKMIANTSFAAGLAITVHGSSAVASADSLNVQQRAQAEMNKGKDYSAAWQEAMRAVGRHPCLSAGADCVGQEG
jgi:hypothetical protein